MRNNDDKLRGNFGLVKIRTGNVKQKYAHVEFNANSRTPISVVRRAYDCQNIGRDEWHNVAADISTARGTFNIL